MSNTEVPSTQESMNSLDSGVMRMIMRPWNKIKEGKLHQDTKIVMMILLFTTFVYIYYNRASIHKPLDKIRILSGFIFIAIIIHSFQQLITQIKYNVDIFCEEPETNRFEIDVSNRIYASFTFIYYYLNLCVKIMINTIFVFAVIYIAYMLAFLQAEGMLHSRGFLQFKWYEGEKKWTILKIILIIPLIIHITEKITLHIYGGIQPNKPKGLQKVDNKQYTYSYKEGAIMNIKEFKEFMAPDHLMHFSSVLDENNIKVHTFVFIISLVFSCLYGLLFIHPVDKEETCSKKQETYSKQVYARMNGQLRIGILVLVTLIIVIYLIFLGKKIIN